MLRCIAETATATGTSAGRPVLVRGLLGDPLPFADGTFDAVVAMRVVKYVRDPQAAACELARVARPGAPVVFDLANPRSVARFGYGRSPMGFVAPARIPALCDDAGLRTVATAEGPRLPHALVGRARSPWAAGAVHAVERVLAGTVGRGSGRLARSVVVAGVRQPC